MVIQTRIRFRHAGCVTERLGTDEFGSRISSDRVSDIVIMQGARPERVDQFVEAFRALSASPPEILARTPTSVMFRTRNPPDEVLQGGWACGCHFLLPTVYTGGVEHLQVIAPARENLDRFLAILGEHGRVEAVDAREAHVDDMGVSVRLADLTRDLTPRQLDILVSAVQAGYYASPRRTSSLQQAEAHGISRSTYEEHLRKGEMRLLSRLADVLQSYPFVGRIARRKAGRPPKA